MAERKGMTEADLQAVIQARLTDSLNGEEASAWQEAQLTALGYYRGDATGKLAAPGEGQSSVVSRDAAEAIDSLMPGLMKIFVGSDKTGVFEPSTEDQQEAADQATDYVNWIWLTKNRGALVFHDVAKDALQYRLGILKVWWQNEERRRREAYKGLLPEEVAALELDDDDEIKSIREYEVTIPGGPDRATGEPTQVPAKLTDIVFYRMHEEGCVKVCPVPQEDFFTDKRAISDESLPFAGHRFQTTVSDLIEDGFDRDQVEKLPSGNDDWAALKTERNEPEDGTSTDSTDTNPIDVSMKKVWVAEVYLKVDYDGDGIAEWRKVTVAGPKAQIEILRKAKKGDDGKEEYEADIAEVDDHPFCTLTPYPTQHKLVGESVVDKVQDIQEVNTALLRDVLDNLYKSNKPRLALGPKASVEDALNWETGHPIRTEDGVTDVRAQVAAITIPFTAGASLQAMEYIDQRKELRIGVSRLTQGLDPNAINKTATGVNAITNFTQDRQALVARIFAEGGMKRLFKKILELVCKYQDKPKVIKLRGKWVTMDPTEWSDEMDFTPSVGIGTGNKDQMLVHLDGIWQKQVAIVQYQGGLNGPLVTAANVYNTLAKMVENAGLKSAELYFTDPGTQPQQPQEQQPDPAMMKAQADIAAGQAKTQADIENKQRQTDANIALKEREQQANFALRAREQQVSQAQVAADGQAQRGDMQSVGQSIVDMLQQFMQGQQERDQKQDQMIAELAKQVASMGMPSGMPA